MRSATGCRASAAGCATSPTRAWRRAGTYVRRLTLRSEETGWDLSPDRRAELNDIKGVGSRRSTRGRPRGAGGGDRSLELMVAVRPNFHHPALFAKQARISTGSAAAGCHCNVVLPGGPTKDPNMAAVRPA
jgi:FMNH2-dependent dimethyl sulfone monooxygenase